MDVEVFSTDHVVRIVMQDESTIPKFTWDDARTGLAALWADVVMGYDLRSGRRFVSEPQFRSYVVRRSVS